MSKRNTNQENEKQDLYREIDSKYELECPDSNRESRGFESHRLHKKAEVFNFGFFYFSFFKSSATFSSSAYQSSPNRRIKASFTNLYTGTSNSFPNEHAGLQISQRS